MRAVYLDDGLVSYVNARGLKAGDLRIFDTFIESLLKRLFLGDWFDKSPMVGNTRWIDECMLCFPANAPRGLRKQVSTFEPASFADPRFLEANRWLVRELGGCGQITSWRGDILLLFPHSRAIESRFGGVGRLTRELIRFAGNSRSKGLEVFFKYHPNEDHSFMEGAEGFREIPRQIALEMLMAQCSFGTVVGQCSSALLSYQWLQPNCDVIAVSPEDFPERALFESVGIRQIRSYNDIFPADT